MKKITAIVFASLLAFNWFGYQMLSNHLQHRADTKVQASIDEGTFNPEQLIELSVNLQLPYTTNWNEWEDVEGDIVIEGVPYRYVQRKLADGKMTVRCLPHVEKQMVVNARDQFVKLSLTMQQGNTGKKGDTQKISISNYLGDYDDNFYRNNFPALQAVGIVYVPLCNTPLSSRWLSVAEPPPNFILA